MSREHPGLAAGRWHELSLVEQLANVGSEVSRALKWEGRNEEFAQRARDRALELLCLTKMDPKHQGRRRELSRLHEVLVNDLCGMDDIKPNRAGLEAYFLAFAVAANNRRRNASAS